MSFQGAREEIAQEISGTKAHAQKLRVLEWLKRHRVAVTLNFVIHRRNIDQLPEMLALAESSSASRVEFANVQYYGWAFANRDSLLPTREQLTQSIDFLKKAQERLSGKIRVEYVVPDYYAKYPKPCMGGWGRKLMLITPNGDALPCHAARVIPGLSFENVKNRSAARNLGRFRRLSKIPRRILDARTLQNVATAAHWISAAAAARRFFLLATPPPQIPSARYPRSAPKSTPFSTRSTRRSTG